MRLIIAGSRFGPSEIPARYAALKEAFAVLPCFTVSPVTEIVSGGARGADKLGERLAAEYGIPCSVHNADWVGLGKRAGYIRKWPGMLRRMADCSHCGTERLRGRGT